RTFGKKEELIFLGREMHEERNYSEKTAQDIDAAVSRLIDSAFERASKILVERRVILEKLAQTLLEKETIEKEEFDTIVGLTPKSEAALV
ncbi:MAG: cell division protein FtsH, partial [Patescibacteria group bacterium]